LIGQLIDLAENLLRLPFDIDSSNHDFAIDVPNLMAL
jgi:hypothetical protein